MYVHVCTWMGEIFAGESSADIYKICEIKLAKNTYLASTAENWRVWSTEISPSTKNTFCVKLRKYGTFDDHTHCYESRSFQNDLVVAIGSIQETNRIKQEETTINNNHQYFAAESEIQEVSVL